MANKVGVKSTPDQYTVILELPHNSVELRRDEDTGKEVVHLTFFSRPIQLDPTPMVEQLRENGFSRRDANIAVGQVFDDLHRDLILKGLGEFMR